jgi:hypothetical protein
MTKTLLCTCCDPKSTATWVKDPRYKAGGYARCHRRNRAGVARYRVKQKEEVRSGGARR